MKLEYHGCDIELSEDEIKCLFQRFDFIQFLENTGEAIMETDLSIEKAKEDPMVTLTMKVMGIDREDWFRSVKESFEALYRE